MCCTIIYHPFQIYFYHISLIVLLMLGCSFRILQSLYELVHATKKMYLIHYGKIKSFHNESNKRLHLQVLLLHIKSTGISFLVSLHTVHVFKMNSLY